MKNNGFVLLTVILLLVLLSGIAGVASLRVIAEWRIARNVERQLYSITLAESGIEYTRALLPSLELDRVLVGVDQRPCQTSGGPEWRNPVSFSSARSIDPSTWTPDCDDGLLEFGDAGGASILPAENGGWILVRITNNPGDGDMDNDGIVVVRSMGLAETALASPYFPGFRNHASVVEAFFRVEKAFQLDAPLIVAGEDLRLELDGNLYEVDGGDRPPVGIVSTGSVDLAVRFREQVLEQAINCFKGPVGEGITAELIDEFKASEAKAELLDGGFWKHFEEHLPEFAQQFGGESSQVPHLVFLPEGGELSTSFRGILVCKGDVELLDGARIEGLLLHLGGGKLSVAGRSEVSGGVWLSNFQVQAEGLISETIELRLADQSRIFFNREALELALETLPPTLLTWRMLFPDMLD